MIRKLVKGQKWTFLLSYSFQLGIMDCRKVAVTTDIKMYTHIPSNDTGSNDNQLHHLAWEILKWNRGFGSYPYRFDLERRLDSAGGQVSFGDCAVSLVS